MELLPTVKQAIQALSHHSETAKANEWLTEFEKSQAAWAVSDLLIGEEKGSPFRFFGAKFLYSKLQRQFYELNSDSAQQLTTTLVQHVLRLGNETPVEYQVVRYICLSIAALAIQLNQPGVVQHILTWLNPIIGQAPGVLLILLTLLPEEVYNNHIDTSPETRDAFLTQLTQSSEEVLNFLMSLWPKMESSTDRCKILKALENWIDIVDIPSALIYKHNALQLILETLVTSEGEIFDAAVDLTIVVVKRYYDKDGSIIQHSLPPILSLQSKWAKLSSRLREEFYHQDTKNGNVTSAGGGASTTSSAGSILSSPNLSRAENEEIGEDDHNEAYSLCRLFTEVAETSLPIFTNLYTNYGQEVLLSLLLECTSFSFDENIAKIPLKFFYELSLLIKPPPSASLADSGLLDNTDALSTISNMSDSTQGTTVSDELGRAMYDKYHPYYAKLLSITIQNIVLPFPMLSGAQKVSDTCAEVRSEWRDTILDCGFVLTTTKAVAWLCNALEEDIKLIPRTESAQQQQQLWAHMEAILLGIYILLPRLSRSGDMFVPQLVSLLVTLPKDLLNLQVTVIDLLGGLASFLQNHRKYLGMFVDKLLGDLANPRTASAASRALMNILKQVSAPTGDSTGQGAGRVASSGQGASSGTDTGVWEGFSAGTILELHERVLSIRSHQSLSLEAELNWLEGLAVAVGHMKASESLQVMTYLLQSQLQGLQQGITSQQSALIIQHLDRLSILVKHYHHGQVGMEYVPMLLSLFSCFDQVIRLVPVEHVSEKICRCYRFGIKHYTMEMIPHLSKLMELLTMQFQFYPVSSFLYAASTIIATYALLPASGNGGSSMSSSTGQRDGAPAQPSSSFSSSSSSSSATAVPGMSSFPSSSFSSSLRSPTTAASAPSPSASSEPSPELVAMIYNMVWQLSSVFFSHYSSMQHFMNKPDVVEEYYYMLAKLLQYIPAPFLENAANAATLLQAAITGLALEHREAQKGILLFLERYIQTTVFWSSEDHPLCQRARQVVLQDQTGGMIVQGLFGLLCGKLPAYAIDESNGCIADVLWLLKRKFPNELQRWLEIAVSNAENSVRHIAEQQKLVESMLTSRAMREFSQILGRFEASSRRALK